MPLATRPGNSYSRSIKEILGYVIGFFFFHGYQSSGEITGVCNPQALRRAHARFPGEFLVWARKEALKQNANANITQCNYRGHERFDSLVVGR